MAKYLTFDLETIPDTDFGRRYLDLQGTDQEVSAEMMRLRMEETDGWTNFQKLARHKVICLGYVSRNGDAGDQINVGSYYSPTHSEQDIVTKFFGAIDQNLPTLISFNGGAFDLPVLHYRAMRHGIQGRAYWDNESRDSKWDNYLSRYHMRHTDLMDVLSGYQKGATASLDELSTLIGLPGKMGIGGAQIEPAYYEGRHEEIRQYCEIDAVNTHLVYVRFQLIRGKISHQVHDREVAILREYLENNRITQPHFGVFLDAWKA